MPAPDDALHLLLARACDHAPVLPDGLPRSALVAPAHPDLPVDAAALPTRASFPPAAAGDEPEDVPAPLLWGVIAPAGPDGDRLLALVDRLVKAREAQQHAPAKVYRVPASTQPMTMAGAVAWRKQEYDSGADLGSDRPRFQLILGDLDQVPLAIQQVQAIDGYVGRLCFADEGGYTAYVDKVLRAEARPRTRRGRIVVHTAHDGSIPLELGFDGLVVPGEALLRAEVDQGKCPASEVVSYGVPSRPGADVLLAHAAAPEPGVLFTLSHGLGAPFNGWSTPAAQRAQQGAMVFGVETTLTGADLATRSFMPDGLWLMFACFGAGTPSLSAYQVWLDRLQQTQGRPPDVARSLSLGPPFVAELPQRVLANPSGPLAFIGHVDLAWTFSYQDDGDAGKARPGRFMRVVKSALEGNAVGIAMAELSAFVVQTDTELNLSYAAGDAAGGAALLDRALLWMTRQDLAGFILLGDPAVRLPVQPDAPAGGATAVAAPPPDLLEQAVGRVLAGEKTVAQAAAETGIDLAKLDAAVAAYRQAGRRAPGSDG